MLKYLSEVDDGTTDLHPKTQTGARWDQFFFIPEACFWGLHRSLAISGT